MKPQTNPLPLAARLGSCVRPRLDNAAFVASGRAAGAESQGRGAIVTTSLRRQQGLILSAEQWGACAIDEIVRAAKTRGVVRRQHAEEAERAAKLAARYALRLLAERARSAVINLSQETQENTMQSRNIPSRDDHTLPDWNPRRVAAEPGHTCEVNECGAPAVLCDLYAEEPEPRFFCMDHRLS